MGKLLPFEINAIRTVAMYAEKSSDQDKETVKNILSSISYDFTDIGFLENQLLLNRGVTLNFHPDRYSNNGKLIIHNLVEQGIYHSQFVTGVTNGGKTAYPGGERDEWEKDLFSGSYHAADTTISNRPKYGALNIFNYLDGASSRFGSCFFVLNQNVMDRCTFAFGDSSTNPEALGTRDVFHPILRALLTDAQKTGRFLNKRGYDVKKVVDYILSIKKEELKEVGRNLDYCIEAHIHGEIDLLNDVDSLFADESFRNTNIYGMLAELTDRYNISLFWIPAREVLAKGITDEFRGPAIPAVAKRIASELGGNAAFIDAALIGKASQFTFLNPGVWSDIGSEHEIFQYLKQLWHTVAYFG